MKGPVFILATDIQPGDAAWSHLEAQAAALASFVSGKLGVAPRFDIGCLPGRSVANSAEHQLGCVIDALLGGGDATELFVLPTALELDVWQRTMLGEELSEARRRHASVSIHHDTVDSAHPFIVECFSAAVLQALDELQIPPLHAGLLLVADGRGDPAARANSYRLMRLIWEQAGLGSGDVGFVRHTQPFLPTVLKRCLSEPRGWLLLPQCQWDGELCEYACVMLADHQRAHPESADWRLLAPPQDHPAIRAWLEQRLLHLWQEKRARQAVRVPSAKYQEAASPTGVWSGRDWVAAVDAPIVPNNILVGRARESSSLAAILECVLPRADRYLVKVTWHGYAQGTYTSAASLEMLLSALPAPAVVLEGHTSSRNLGGLDIDWEADAIQNRTVIRQQDVEFLRRTGLADVLARYKAQYVNVTEAWWDGACASATTVQAALGNTKLSNPELAEFVPAVLMELRGAPLISFARFKGPTRLGISNFFGLIPHPLRTAWHGATITDFAAVCCDLVTLYGSLFPLFGLVEAFDSAVRWDRKGLYRSRWGNYDLVLTDGLFTLSEGLVGADVLASRLQTQDVRRSAYFDVVRNRLGWTECAEQMPLPIELQALLA